MFTSMSAFLAFFIPSVILILLGIVFEEKLIRIEQAIKKSLLETIAEKRYQKAIRVAYKGYTADKKAKEITF